MTSNSAPRPRTGPDVPGRSGNGEGELRGPGDYASRVLEMAETIPPGRVMSYGDIAEYLGEGGPRQVGRVMLLWGGGVARWRHTTAGHAPGALGRRNLTVARAA